ncbi:hypothetical protein BUALT_BualtUnG0049200 [Buddleja alternifolia]|uniref:Uncharacterized protein n=1 Tax=Buddleja alternifolia TaxID=168488 RepID=A0AAV6W641_9LAMI|nr:hypothetical protein BUALT_BualtUnG0049200 [Buddleja alternifolia]
MENLDTPPDILVMKIRAFVSTYQESNLTQINGVEDPLTAAWKPPDEGVIKINFDGGNFSEQVDTGSGVIGLDQPDSYLHGVKSITLSAHRQK